ncbi:MAG: rod shape-determining protein RodA [Candidatus Omnitrophica bacterium]|nr:rod shape-determining protein RodA [Candidatus Omnitrophota bacterium]
MRKNFKTLNSIDWSIPFLALTIFLAGLTVLYSASFQKVQETGIDFPLRQVGWFLISCVVFFLAALYPYRKWVHWAYPFYAVNILLLILTLLLGLVRFGAQRWLAVGGLIFQPSELSKLVVTLTLAQYMGHNRQGISSFRGTLVVVILVGVPLLLIAAQPDLGTALTLVPVLFSLFWVAGVPRRWILLWMAAGFFAAPLLWWFLRDYQKDRLMVFLNPNVDPLGAGYTIIQSKIAIGSGGFLGKGWLSGTQNQLSFLPERHTDFIFSVVGEEWGFAGALILLLLYCWFIRRMTQIIEQTHDPYGKLLAAGITTLLAVHVLVNIGMTSGIMPVVGLPLPLVSYGGSNMLTFMIGFGLMVNIQMRR